MRLYFAKPPLRRVWGQAYLLIPWFITIPVVIVLGALLASMRRRDTGEGSEKTSSGR